MVILDSRPDKNDLYADAFEVFYADVVSLGYQYRAEIKSLYDEYGNEMQSGEYKMRFAKLKLLAYYLQSLEVSNFSPDHASFGEFVAAFISKCDWDDETEAALRTEYGFSPITADLHFDDDSSYYKCIIGC